MKRILLTVTATLFGLMNLATTASAQTPSNPQERQAPPPRRAPQLFPVPKNPEYSNAAFILQKFGMIGDFSADCSTPLGGPGHVVYTAQPNGVVLSVSQLAQNAMGLAGGFARYTFLHAEQVSPSELKVRAFTSPLEGEVEVTFFKDEKDRFRLISSLQLGTGVYLIKDSQHRGYTYKWVERCGKDLSS